jgi:hypothetical protein
MAPRALIDGRQEAGRAARADAPRSVHAAWSPSADRRDPVDLLEEQASSRVPDLVPVRYGRMLASPFAFFRGAAYIMAADLATTHSAGLDVQLCGDAHLSNFGGFAAPDRRLVFSINDFDETLPGPFEWDVKAPRRELRGRRACPRLQHQPASGRRARGRALLPKRDAGLRIHAPPRRVVRPARRNRDRGALRAGREPHGTAPIRAHG